MVLAYSVAAIAVLQCVKQQSVSIAGMQHMPYCYDVCAIMHMQFGSHPSAPLSGPTRTLDTQVRCSRTSLQLTHRI